MSRYFPALRLALLAPLALACADTFAGRTLERVDYFSPVTFRFVLRHEDPAAETAKGTANTVSVVRHGNRDVLAPIVATYGGKLSDWSLVAYSNSTAFDSFSDLAIVALRKNGDMYPVQTISLADLDYSAVSASDYTITTDANEDVVSAFFDQNYLATCDQSLFGGTLLASGKIAHAIRYGRLVFPGASVQAFKPGAAKLRLVGEHTDDENSEISVAELTITFGPPRLVPRFSASSSGGGGTIVITPGGPGSSVSPN